MWLVSAAAVALKKTAVVTPAMVALFFAVLPMSFNDVALALGPHVLAAIGGTIGTAVRFVMLRMAWRAYPMEALAAMALGGIFGQVPIPVVTELLSKTSPEVFPVAQGTAIGILMAAGTGFLSDFINAYRNRITGGGK